MAHYDIFRHHLLIKFPAYGHALWDPEPGRLYTAVEIGDVGYIREGKFYRLFNALLPANHPSHRNFGVAEYHEELTLNMESHINNCKLSPNNFCSAKVTSMPVSERFAEGPNEIPKVTFSCPMKEGAVLSLPIQANGENTVAMADFGKWIMRHIDRWFAWVRQLGLGVNRMEDIILVTGTHRTRSWTNVVFPGGQGDARATFGAKVNHNGDVIVVNWRFSHELNRGAVLNCGPDGEDLPEDQCIFVRGFRVTRKLKILPPRLKGAAGPNPDKKGHDGESDVELIPIPSIPEYRDPLYVLLEYIAEEAPNSDMVLVHDNDLAHLHGVYLGAPLGPLASLQPDAMLSLLRASQLRIHETAFDTDTESMSIATLSNLFEEPPLFHAGLRGTRTLLQRMATMYPNTQANSAQFRARASSIRQTDAQSGQGERGQSSYMEVDSAFTHYPGSGVVNTPAFYSQRARGLARGVASSMSQITGPYPQVPQKSNRTPVPRTGNHRSSPQYNSSVPCSFGAYTSNPSAGHIPSSSYFPADPRPPSIIRSTGGTSRGRVSVPPQIQGSASFSSSSNAHQSRPRCILPRCEKSAIFDRTINEQWEFCEDHMGHMIPVGFAGCCVVCRKMPARLDSEFCSDACRSMNAQMGSSSNNAGHQQQPPSTTRPSSTSIQRSVSSSGESAAVGVPGNQRWVENSVPEGLLPTCQECRRPIMKETCINSCFCSKACDEANRKYNRGSKSHR